MPSADKRAIRRSFEQAAAAYEDAAFLQKEVARRLDERLDLLKTAPARILDAGCGTGFGLPMLRARYPEASLVCLDIAYNMVARARDALPSPWWRRGLAFLNPPDARLAPLCADIERLPLASNSLDMVWSNLALQWVGDLEATFSGLRQVLKPGGLLVFSTFGPDTLKELRAAFADLDGHGHVNRFIDMHDIGDMLVHAGYSHPVMEMERITLTYTDLKGLLRELKDIGAHTVLENRRTGLMGRREWQRLSDNYERFRKDGRLPATYEVVYGHAWAGAKDRLADGRQVIQMKIASRKGVSL